LTNTVLSLMDTSSPGHEVMFGRCRAVETIRVSDRSCGLRRGRRRHRRAGDWVWSLPVALAALAIAFATHWTIAGMITHLRGSVN
jgi:hypothetical protein